MTYLDFIPFALAVLTAIGVKNSYEEPSLWSSLGITLSDVERAIHALTHAIVGARMPTKEFMAAMDELKKKIEDSP